MDVMKLSRRVLIVDDDPGTRDWLGQFATGLGYDIELLSTGEAAVESFRSRRPDLVTLDVLLPGMDGLATLRALRSHDASVPVIILSGHGPTKTIVDAVRDGATDFLRKPIEPEELELAFDRALSPGRSFFASRLQVRLPDVTSLFDGSDEMRRVLGVIESVADTDITVLIRGESGVGKEVVAQAIYAHSTRTACPFIKINCAALPSELLESELFGYEKGAFTGAQRRKLGKFELADTGTIFLDEISEMHPRLQAKLLQVLQDGQFSRLGGETDVHVDARVIAATNRDLEVSVRNGSFREDLFYRLNVVTIRIPPLRDRPDEIPRLTDRFLRLYTEEYGKEEVQASDALRQAFAGYRWPGNVRELENLIKRLVVLGAEEPVLQELRTRAGQAPGRSAATRGSGELARLLRGEIDRASLKRIGREAALAAERRLIERVLERTRWNRRQTAEVLQISYKALLYKIKDAGLAKTG